MRSQSQFLFGQSSQQPPPQPWNIFQLSHIKFQQLHSRPAELQLINLHACKYVQMDGDTPPLHPPPLSRSSLFCCHRQKQRQQQRIWLNWLASAAKALRAQFAYIRFVIIIVDHRFKWGNAAAAARTEAGRNCESEYRTESMCVCAARTVMICRAHLHPAACGRLSDAHSLINAAQRATARTTATAEPAAAATTTVTTRATTALHVMAWWAACGHLAWQWLLFGLRLFNVDCLRVLPLNRFKDPLIRLHMLYIFKVLSQSYTLAAGCLIL